MATYELKTFGDILSAAREELGISATDTTALNRLKRDIQITYSQVLTKHDWWWTKGECDVSLEPYFNAGSASVTTGSAAVTLSTAPTYSVKGYMFAVDGFNELYKVESHTAGSTAVKLTRLYNGTTGATVTFRLWTDHIPLPTSVKDVVSVRHDFRQQPLDEVGVSDFRKMSQASPRAENKPVCYYTGDYVDPQPTSAIASLPAITSRASAGMVKTIVFSSSLPSAVTARQQAGYPNFWRISNAGEPSYNGDISVASITTTTAANDTITYTGSAPLQESATSDGTMSVQTIDTPSSTSRYRELVVWPSQVNARIALHLDFVRNAPPLENLDDEPLIPVHQRDVILYGALRRGWAKQRNKPEADTNEMLYDETLAKMEGELKANADKPQMRPSKAYLSAKRSSSRGQLSVGASPFGFDGGMGSGAIVSGPANTLAYFNNSGVVQGAGSVSSTTDIANMLAWAVLSSASLADNQASASTWLSYNAAAYGSAIIEFSISRGSGNHRVGTLWVSTDGSSVDMAQSGSDLGSVGVTLSASVSGGNVLLQYASTSTGTAPSLKYIIRRWA
jgi:hypothetical protein